VTGVDKYFLGYRDAEQMLLQRQAEQLAGESAWLFDQVRVLNGGQVVEIGCGPHGYTYKFEPTDLDHWTACVG
jgi:hypothetical protein